MALPGPTLSHLTMLPLCAAPSLLHKPPSSLLRLSHLRAPHSPRLPLLALATLSFHTTPSFAIAAHGLLLPPVQAHSAIFMVLRTPLSLPLLLSELQFVRAPLPPRPCRLQLSQDSPPLHKGPLRACCLSSCRLFISLHIPVPMWAFFWEEQNLSARQLPGEQERAGERDSTQEREAREVVRGSWGKGSADPGRMWVVGRQPAKRGGGGGDRELWWRWRVGGTVAGGVG